MTYMLDEDRDGRRVLAMILAMIFGLGLVAILFAVQWLPIVCGRDCSASESAAYYGLWALFAAFFAGLTRVAYRQIDRPSAAGLWPLGLIAMLTIGGIAMLLR